MLVLFITLSASPAVGQDVDPFYQWVQNFLAASYNIETDGATFMMGSDPEAVLGGRNAYGGSSTVLPADAADADVVGWEHYVRYDRTASGDNQWTGGVLFEIRESWAAGDVGLLVSFYRGGITGGPPTLPLQYEVRANAAAGVVWNAPFGQRQLQVTPDWTVVLIPFEVSQNIPPNNSHLAFWTGDHVMTLDLPAPVMLNLGNRYTVSVLQHLIDTEGQIPLAANFTASTRRGVPPFEVTFDASTSVPAADITSYAWDFGDGTMGSGVMVSHTYSEEGRYTVRLTVTGSLGEIATFTRQLVSFDGVGLPESPLEIPYTATPPIIDGTVDAMWAGAPELSVTFHVGGLQAPTSPEDLSATARAMWDQANLYVLFEVTDDDLRSDSPEFYQDDSVELYVDGRNEKTLGYDVNDAQYGFRWYPSSASEPPPVAGNAVENGRAEGVEYRVSTVTGGYVVEAMVPWSNVDGMAIPGSLIGIDFMVNDSDVPGAVQSSKTSWYSLEDVAWQRMDGIGTAMLVGGEDEVTAAQFSWSTPTGRYLVDVPVDFDASESYAPGTIVEYAWDFGDGQVGSGISVQHAYRTPGAYLVSLTITDDRAVSHTRAKTISVVDGTGLPEKPLLVPRAETAPVIDGIMEGAWSGAQLVRIATRANNNPPVDDEDLSATAHLMWDDEYFYVFFTVTDDVLRNDSESTWQDDSAEVYLDGHNDKTFEGYNESDGQFEFGWDADEVTGCTSCVNPESIQAGVEFGSFTTDVGYNIEAKIPWANFGVTPADGHDFGLELMVNDDDNDGSGTNPDVRDTKLQWFGQEGQDNPWRWAHVWGNARLVTRLPTNVADGPSELPETFAIEGVYPNPFNPRATAVLQIPHHGEYQMRVYNLLGQLITRRGIEAQRAGRLEVALDFDAYASGVYFITVEQKATGNVATARAVLLK